MTMQQVKNINKTDKHIHSHKKRYLEVISRFTKFKEFNGEKKNSNKNIEYVLNRSENRDMRCWFYLFKISLELSPFRC